MDDQQSSPPSADGVSPGELGDFLEWRDRVRGTNISEKTLLATDYLNHFNEIVMLIEMIPAMPEMMEECLSWQPRDYREHFRESGFSDRDLAIAAYEHVPARFRTPFEDTIARGHQVVAHTLERLAADLRSGDTAKLEADCQASAAIIHRVIQVANGIIHGTTHVMEQAEIDQYLGSR
ncbi:hypothetical protein [Azospirillum sp. SYSU D00513]|uniref:hypothetical protein n=1 Tax=Azospirillum sp. SYSU D00513 TaxID=2812561 RepID=UPI001A970240|nr:hypothetical protein [Azospirillum sp. SYSU D00513]